MSSRNDRRAEDGGVQGQPPTVYQYGDENSSVPLADEVEGIKAENLDGSSVEVKKLKKRFLRMFRLGKEKQEAPGEVSMTAPAGDNVDVPTVAADLSAPSATMDDPDASVDVSKPSRDVDTIAEMLSFGGKVEAPTPVVSVDVSAPSADRSGLKGPDKPAVEVPSVDDNVDVSTPDVSVNVSTASVDVGGKMPDVFGGVPDVSAEVPKVDDVGMSAPDVSMSAPGVGVSDDSAKVKDVKVELPDAPSAEGKTPKKGLRRIIDLAKRKLEALEIKGSVPDVKIPEVSGDISAPSASGDVPMPLAHVPSVKAGVSPSPVKGHAPEGGVSVTAPNVRVGVSAPSVDEGVQVPEMPSAGVPPADLPSIGGDTSVSAPGVSMPSVDVDSKAPDVAVDVPAVGGTKMSVDVSAPSVGLGGQVPEMPSASGPSKGMGGKPDVSLDVPAVTGANVSVDVTAPSVDLGGQVRDKPVVSGPSVDPPSVGGDVSVSVPGVSIPLAEVSGKVPDVSVDIPAADEADVSVDVLAPSVLDGKVPETSSVSGPPVDKPSVGGGISVSAPGVSMPSVDMGDKVPDMSVDVPAVDGASVSVPDASVEVSGLSVSAPEASLAAPGVEVSRVAKVDASVPSMEGSKATSDNVTAGVSTEVGGGEVDVKGSEVPSVDVKPKKRLLSRLILFGKGNVEGPNDDVSEPAVEVNVCAPSASVEASAGVSTEVGGGEVDVKGSEVPSVDVKPKKRLLSRLILFGKGNVEGPNDDVSEPAVEVNVCAPSASVEASAGVSTEVGGGEVDVKGSEVPSVDVKPKKRLFSRLILFDKGNVEGPNDDVSEPAVEVNVCAPSASVEASAGVSTEVGGGEVDVKGSEVPSVDVKPKKRLLSRLTLFDKGNVEGPNDDVSEPAVEVNVCAPSASVEASGAKSGPEASGMPSVSAPSVDVPSGVGGDVSVAAPQQSAGVSPPASVDVAGKVAEVSVNVPSVGDVGASALDVSATATDVSSKAPDVSAPGVDASVPQDLKASADNTAAGASMSAKTDDIEVKTPDPSLDAKKPRRPSFLSMLKWSPVIGKIEAADVDVPEPGVEVNVSAPSSTVDVSAPEVSTKAEGETVDADVTEHSPMAVAKPVILGGRRSGGRRVFSKYLGRKNKADASNVTKPDASVTEPDASVSAPDATMSTPTVEVLGAKNVANESASLRISPASKPDTDPEDAKSAEVDSSRLSAVFDAAIGGVDDEDTSGATTESDRVPLPPVPEASPDGDSDLTQKLAAALDAAGVPVDEGQADDEDTDIDVEAPVVPSEDEDHGSVTGGVIGFLFGGGEARHEEGPTEETPAAASEDSTPAAKSVPDVTSPLKESSAGTSRDNDTLTSMFFGSSPKDKMTNEPAAESTSKQSEEDKDNDKNDGGFFGMIAEQLGLIPSNGDEDETAAPAAADADAGATT